MGRLALLSLLLLPVAAAEAPRLEVASPQGGTVVAGGGAVVVAWTASPSDGTVLLLASQDEGVTWKEVACRPAEAGLFLWETGALPEDAPVRLRLRLRDALGATLAETDAPGSFKVDRRAPSARVVGPESAESARVEVQVESSDEKGSGISAVLLWAAEPGKPWTMVAESKDPAKPVSWTAPHRGRWNLYATAVDKAGNIGSPPGASDEPQAVLFVRSPEPWISSFSVDSVDYVVPPGYLLPLSWTVEADDLGAASVTIEARGEKGEWIPVGMNLPAQGRMTWKTPGRSGALPPLRLRATAGRHESVRELTPWIMVDADPPRVDLRGPTLWEKPEGARLDLGVFDNLAGVASVTLWWRNPEGGAWGAIRTTETGKGLTFQSEDARHALWVSAKDSLGNATPDPQPGDAPMLEILLDRAAPETAILAPKGGGVVDAGRPFTFAWTATDANLPGKPVALFASRDAGATWELWQDSLPSNGETPCTAPREAGPLWLRLVALDAAGRRGEAFLEPPLQVRATGEAVGPPPPPPPQPPVEVTASDIPVLEGLPVKGGAMAGGRPVELSWKAPASPEGLSVLVEMSADDGATWQAAGKADASAGRLAWQVPALNRTARLRLSLHRGEKRLGFSLSRPFVIASKPPRLGLKIPAPEP